MNFRQNDKALPVNTAKPNLVAFFVFSGTASSFICKISSFVTEAKREAIFLAVYVSFPICSEVNSKGYSEFEEPISARQKRYPLFEYILK